jgi:hypothetical protein
MEFVILRLLLTELDASSKIWFVLDQLIVPTLLALITLVAFLSHVIVLGTAPTRRVILIIARITPIHVNSFLEFVSVLLVPSSLVLSSPESPLLPLLVLFS